ncbi:porin family protein [Acidicapsa ligni]|uniref:porin family protein n=1 Tax=Acidicapsa ligni TaxID=542300 RepID=UPI0021DFB891|nr:porin family protein [Acidicapsa ligni]
MQWKNVLATFLICLPVGAIAQVAPSAKVRELPIGIGVGFSRYDLDYGPSRYMEGLVVRAGVGLWRGVGVDVSARTIFMNTPPELTRMQQNTFLGGVYYEGPQMYHFRPFVRGAGGVGTIEFPSKNPQYTRDTYTVYAPSAGVEIPITRQVYARGEYEYQFWKDFQSTKYLNPQGFTIGVTYYPHGLRSRRHPEL